MKKNILLFIILSFFFSGSIFSQVITFQNPSFEGTPGTPHVTPPLWNICQPGYTPDTQPNCWGITLPPSNGNSYVGMVHQSSSGWQEGVGQMLSSPMVVGTTYAFSVDLATVDPSANWSTTGIIPGCVELQVWANLGGNSGCDESYLCWSSGNVTNFANWQTHEVSFTATQNWTNLLFMAHSLGCTDGPYLLMDNLSNSHIVVLSNHDTTICANHYTISASNGFDQYLWSTGATTPTINVSTSGLYFVTATLNNIDTIVDSIHVSLTQPYLNLNLGNDTLICGNGNVTLDAGNGFANYSWNTGSTSQSININQTGLYNVYATDTAHCNYFDTIKIIINPAQSLNLGNDTGFCYYGTYPLDAGVAFDSYQWSTGENTQSIIADSTGTYYVTATNYQCSVTATDSVNLIFHDVPIANAGPDDTICKGTSATLQATGGNLYAWSPSAGLSCTNCSNPTASPQHSTVYSVIVTNLSGCTASDYVNVNVITANTSITNASCGQSNGTATVNVFGGSGLYTYLWNTSPQQNTQTAVNLAPGVHTVSVTDITIGCSVISTDTINNVGSPIITFTNVINANCGMYNGSMTASVTGGNPPYTYLWNSVPQQNSHTLLNVLPGYYCLTVTDFNNCQEINCDTIGVDAYAAPEICMVSVDTSINKNEIIWEKPVTTGIDKYYIFRETSVSGIYNLIGTQNYSDFSTFIDTSSNSLQQPYRYELAIHDNCGLTSQQSTYHQTVHLTVNAGMGGSWNLLWNNYEGFAFTTYNIYRGTNPGNMTFLNSVSSNVNSFSDMTPPAGLVYYLVEVVKPTACNPSFKTKIDFPSTISNIASSDGLGITEMITSDDIQIYPNPGNGLFTLTINGTVKNAEIEISNSLGQVIYHSILNSNKESLDISGFSKGVYFMKLSSNEYALFKKIVLQ